MNSPENDTTREEMALDALIAAAFNEDLSEVDDKDIEGYGNALTNEDRHTLDAAGENLIESLFAGEIKKPKEQESEKFSTSMNRGNEGAALTDRASEEKDRKIREAREKRKALARNNKIQENDIVRVCANLQVEGYSLQAGMTGTVVTVYRNGEAFAVEFPTLERGSAVVTLYRDQVEPVEGTDE